MDVCVVEMNGTKFKIGITDSIIDSVDDMDELVEHHFSRQRVFDDIFKAVDTIRAEEKKNGMYEYWCDEERDEESDKVSYVYLSFKDKNVDYKIDKSFYFNVREVEFSKSLE